MKKVPGNSLIVGPGFDGNYFGGELTTHKWIMIQSSVGLLLWKDM